MKNSLLFFSLFIFACGGGGKKELGNLQVPVDIRASSTDITFKGRAARFAYVADQLNGSISVIDQQKEDIIDTDKEDDEDRSPIVVGGEPSAIAIQERTAPRIFVADAEHHELWAFDMVPPSDPNSDELIHVPVDLSGTTVGRASRPIFLNSGRTSSPVINSVSVDPGIAQNEHWELKFENEDKGYKVTGSKSGRQSNNALEDVAYSTDDGSMTFTVRSGGDVTTGDDKFRFGSVVGNPMALTGRPVDLQIDSTRLFIVTQDPPTLITMDLTTFVILSTLPITDGSLVTAVPGKSVLGSGHLYIPNQAAANTFDVDLAGPTLTTLATGVSARAAGLDGETNTLYLLPAGRRELARYDLVGATLAAPIRLTDFGFTFVGYTIEGVTRGIIPTASGAVDVFDVASGARVDADVINQDRQSDTVAEEFQDLGARSSPSIIAIATDDAATLTERWQLVFEGVVPGTSSDAGSVAGDVLTLTGATFVTSGIAVGDRVVLSPDDSPEELGVAQITSETTLQLVSTPSHQGTVTMEIRPSHQYVVVGSISGPQKKRIIEGVSYASDNNAIGLQVRPSLSEPTTRGDMFTFLSIDGTDPIHVGQRHMARSAVILTEPTRSEPFAYVTQASDGSITVLDLNDLKERNTFH